MNHVDIMDMFYPKEQKPFSADYQPESKVHLVRINRATLYVSRERLAELHSVISAALESKSCPMCEHFGIPCPVEVAPV